MPSQPQVPGNGQPREDVHEKSQLQTARKASRTKAPEAVFLASITGVSLMFGFGMTLAMAKKKDPNFFHKGLLATRDMPQSGGALAMRALGWGTLYAVTGVGLLSFTVWKLLGVGDLEELRDKMQQSSPRVPKQEPQGRSEFSSIRELVNYVLDEDRRKRSEK